MNDEKIVIYDLRFKVYNARRAKIKRKCDLKININDLPTDGRPYRTRRIVQYGFGD